MCKLGVDCDQNFSVGLRNAANNIVPTPHKHCQTSCLTMHFISIGAIAFIIGNSLEVIVAALLVGRQSHICVCDQIFLARSTDFFSRSPQDNTNTGTHPENPLTWREYYSGNFLDARMKNVCGMSFFIAVLVFVFFGFFCRLHMRAQTETNHYWFINV
jgi:hypothetical protein